MPTLGFIQPEWNDGVANVNFKKKNLWRFVLPSISASGINSLPPLKSARPSLSFKDITVEHLNETISYPGKPEWKPIALTLYDLNKGIENPVFTWIRRLYDVRQNNCSAWKPCLSDPTFVIPQAYLNMYDYCGNIIETWILEHVWPQNIEFGDLDMNNGTDVCMVDLTLKYHRAYINLPNVPANINFPPMPQFVCGVPPEPTGPNPENIPDFNQNPIQRGMTEPVGMHTPVRLAEFKINRW